MSDAATAKKPAEASAIPPEELDRMTDDIIASLKTVYDPEIRSTSTSSASSTASTSRTTATITIDMTLTAPGCPVAGEMPGWVQNAVSAAPGVNDVKVNMTFDPPWDQSRMSDEARVALDMW